MPKNERAPHPKATMKQREVTRMLAYAGMTLALATVLSLIKLNSIIVFSWINGGSITAASMLPIVLFALAFGTPWGLLAGATFGIIQLIIQPFAVHPIQVLLDYPIAFAAIGLAGLFGLPAKKKTETSDPLQRLAQLPKFAPILGTLLAMASRLLAHVVSGVVFFASSAPVGQNVWIYSLVYNATYMVPETIVTITLLTLLLTVFRRVGRRP